MLLISAEKVEDKISIFNWRSELNNPGIDAIGEDVVLFNHLMLFPALNYPFKSDIFIEMICIRGEMQLIVNLEEFTIQSPCVFSIMPDKIVQLKSISDDFSAKFLLLSSNFLTSLLTGPRERLPLFLSVNSNPLLPLNEQELDTMLEYYKLYQREIRKTKNPARLEAVRHLIQAGFYGNTYLHYDLPEKTNRTKHEVLTEEFLNLVNMYYKDQREVGYYAEKLHLTPKYLSKIIKDNSGKSAHAWIDDLVVLEAKALLKSTNMNVQQISDHLNFPSQSFFGKYFKRRVGISPKEFRGSS